MRTKYYIRRTEGAYIYWRKKYIFLHNKWYPIEMSEPDVKAVIDQLSRINWIITSLLYGSGLRLNECLQLRVQNLGFKYNQITM